MCPCGQDPGARSCRQQWAMLSGALLLLQEGGQTQAFPDVKTASAHAVFRSQGCGYLGASQLLICPWTLLPPGWPQHSRDVFCKLQEWEFPRRGPRKQSKASQAWRAEPLFRGPSWERAAPVPAWSLGHTCDWPPLQCCPVDPRQQRSLLRQCLLACVSVCKRVGVQGTKLE